MASSTAELAILLHAKDEASKVLQQVGGSVGGLQDRVANLAKVGLTAMTVGIGAAVAASVGFAKAAADEEVGIARLAQAVKNAGGDWSVLGATVEGQISQWQKLTAFSDDDMRGALSSLVAMTGDVDEAMRRLPTAMDLARGAGMDLAAASKLVGKVSDENVTALKRLGVVVKDGATATDLLAEVQKRFGGQSAAFAATAAGQWKIFSDQLGDLQEEIGAHLLPLFKDLAAAASGGPDWLKSSGALDAFAGGLKTALTIMGELFGVLTGRAPDAGAALKGVVGPEVATIIMQWLAYIRDAFKAIVAGDIPRLFAVMQERVPAILGAVFSIVREAVPRIGEALLEWGRQFIAWVGPQIPPLLEELRRLLGVAMGWLEAHAEEIGQTLVSWGGAMAEVIVTKWIPLLMEKIPQVQQALATWILNELGPSLVRILIGIGKGIVEGLWSGIQGAWDWLIGNVRAAIAQLPEVVKRFLGIASPSTVFMSIGEDIAAGLAAGIRRGAPQAIAAVQQMIAALHPVTAAAVAAAPAIYAGNTNTTGMQPGTAIVGPDGTVVFVTPSMAAGGSVSFGGIPSFDRGGVMPRDGLALLHRGETVTPADRAGEVHVHVNVTGPVYGFLDFEQQVTRAVREAILSGGFRGIIPAR